ncbi:MAG: L,D-transpeptidase [Thermomicrobiales bacterium]|nr:L,D-transpeptidase [Thermomicrobiales bacterium]MCO5223516.1 L,D-transpeptidase [Thermomicrobiales bacterium]
MKCRISQVDRVARTRATILKGGSRAFLLAFAALLTLTMFPLGTSAQDDWSAPRTVYIPETGHTIDGVFLDVWRDWGGASAFGNPITQEFEEDGQVVQYYEYARFEYVPDDPDGQVVHFGEIGRELKPNTVFRAKPALASTGASTDGLSRIADELRAWAPLTGSEARIPDSPTRRYIEATQHTIQNGFKDFWEATGEASFLGNPLTEEFRRGDTTYQIFERGKLSWTEATGVAMEPVGSILVKQYGLETDPQSDAENYPWYSEDLFIPPPPPEPVTPSNPGGERWVYINLSSQYLVAYEGDLVVNETYVSTGRPGFDTPTGTYYINSKYDIQDMQGLVSGESWYVPDVPHVMYFTDVGHAFHGTYWHGNFGAVMSHGCINLPMWFAEWMYYWAPYGMRVQISY